MKIFIQLIVLNILFLNIYANEFEDFTYTLPNYKYYQFDNGFELIAVENHTNPLIATVTVIRTGLRNEIPGNNGVSHMLEHMTFNGTNQRTQKQLYDELDFHGIYLNAQTSEDYTTFMALQHKDHMETAIDIMSDMLFNSTFPTEKFEKEKGIITEEIRKDSENPDFKKELALKQAFYKNPPYSMPVIGTIETVQNMSREHVLNYYNTYYSPDNMITIVIGDFKKDEIVKLFKKYFSHSNPRVKPAREVQYQQEYPFFYQEEDEKEQILYLKLPSPIFHSNFYIPFQFFYSHVLDPENGVLIKNLKSIDSLKIKKISPSNEFHPGFGVLTLKITAEKNVLIDDIKETVLKELQQISSAQMTAAEKATISRSESISEILMSEKIIYYGFLKSQELAIGGREAYEKKIPAILQENITQINEFLGRYPELWNNPAALYQAGNWTESIALNDYPQAISTSPKSESHLCKYILDNGLTVIHLQNTDNAVLAMHLLFKNRSAWESADKQGIADFLHHSLFKASKNFPEDKLDKSLKKIGAEIKAFDWDFIPYDDYYSVPEYSYIRVLSLDQFFDKTFQIVADNIKFPDLETYFSDVKQQMINLARREQSSANKTARGSFLKMLFGSEHPLSQSITGIPSSIEAIQLEDLEKFQQKYYTGGNTIISVVSSLDSALVISTIEKYFSDLPRTAVKVDIPQIPIQVSSRSDSAKIGSQQSYIYLGYSFAAELEQQIPLMIMNDMLSRQITFSLREEKGWAYRLGSTIDRWQNNYYFYTSMGTGREHTHKAISSIIEEIEKFKFKTINEQILQQSKNSILGSLTRRRASRENQAFILGTNEFYNYPSDFFFTIYDQIKAVSLDLVSNMKNQHLRPDDYHLFYTIPGEQEVSKPMMPRMPPGMKY
jgi:zinc protease